MSSRYSAGGAYNFSTNWTPNAAASYLFCAWLLNANNGAVNAANSLTVTPRAPRTSLTISAPATVTAGETFQITATAQNEVGFSVVIDLVPDTGRGCPANADAVTGADTITSGWYVVGGPESQTKNESYSTAGPYLLCGYDGGPLAATVPITLLAPCVVPEISYGTSLASVSNKLTAAGCTVGKVKNVASARYKKGTVVKVGQKAGTTLAPKAAIALQVSTGPPCVVPRLAGKSLGQAKAALKRAHCTAGGVSRVRSRTVRSGRVVRSAPGRGKRLATNARVALVVSKGR
jgi:hypothetical protein